MNNIADIILSRPDIWYYEKGYLTVDLELFGINLCALFNKYLGEHYYFQKFHPKIKTDNNRPIWQQWSETKNLAIISPTLHDENSNRNYSREEIVYAAHPHPQFLTSYTSYSEEYPSLFTKKPLELDDNDFLLYIGDYSLDNVQVYLGTIKNGIFMPSKVGDGLRVPVTVKSSGNDTIRYNNPVYPFIEDFMREIFFYKISNKKPVLDQCDMDLILEKFEISKSERMQTLIELLKSIKDQATEKILSSNTVGKMLEFNKIDEPNK